MSLVSREAREVLERAMVARLATVSVNGRPHVNPLYFVLEREHIHLGTMTETLAARNVRANPKVQILFEVEANPSDRRVLSIGGEAVVVTDPPTLRRYKRRNAWKYFWSLAGLRSTITHIPQLFLAPSYFSGSSPCVIEVEPTSFEVLTAPA